MSPPSCDDRDLLERLSLLALQALPSEEAGAIEAHVATCDGCRRELETARATVRALTSWPTDVLRPPAPLWDRVAERIASEGGKPLVSQPPRSWTEPAWEAVALGISVKLLATDRQRRRVSMLVRLDPGTDYPPHVHAGVEELHLLDGELWIDERKLHPGDYSRADRGSADARVWSETGCTCVLITSPDDVLR